MASRQIVELAGGIAQQFYSPQSYQESQTKDDCDNAVACAIRHCVEPGNGESGHDFHFDGPLPAEAEQLLHRLHEPTVSLIRENWDEVERVAAAFLKNATLTQAEIDVLMTGAAP